MRNEDRQQQSQLFSSLVIPRALLFCVLPLQALSLVTLHCASASIVTSLFALCLCKHCHQSLCVVPLQALPSITLRFASARFTGPCRSEKH